MPFRPCVARAAPPVGARAVAALLAAALLAAAAPLPAQSPTSSRAAPHDATRAATRGASHQASSAPTVDAPTMGVHGMLVAGGGRDGRVVLSHLPLYRPPHDRQLLLVARLGRGAGAYAADRARTGGRLYTLEPERFPLARLTHAAAGDSVRFRATLYRGHFERGGAVVARGVDVVVERVLVSRPLRAASSRADSPAARGYAGYLLRLGDEVLLAHRVGGAPNYDQVVVLAPDAADAHAHPLLRAAGDGAVPVAVTRAPGRRAPDGRAGDAPIAEGTTVWLTADGAAPVGGHPLRARVARQLYLEHEDLTPPRPAATAPH